MAKNLQEFWELPASTRTFHEFLRLLHEDRAPGMSSDSVADAIGVDRTAVWRFERGSRSPKPEKLGKLLDLYGATDEERLEAWRLRSLPRDEPAQDEVLPQEAGEDSVPARAAS